MNTRISLALVAGALAATATPARADSAPVDLGTLPGGSESAATAFGARGDIVGWSRDATGAMRAVRWHDGRIEDLGVPRSGDALALDENARGTIVGNAGDRAFAWRRGRTRILPLAPGAVGASARRINARGQIAGVLNYPDGHPHGALWDRSGVHDLGTPQGYSESNARGINDRGDIGGWVYEPVADRVLPARWSPGGWHVLSTLGGRDGQIFVIDDRGVGAGLSVVSDTVVEGALWAPDGGVRGIGHLPGGDFSWILGGDGHGSYVGNANTAPGGNNDHAFVSVAGGPPRALPFPPAAVSTNAHDLDDRGAVAGDALDADGHDHAIVWRASTVLSSR